MSRIRAAAISVAVVVLIVLGYVATSSTVPSAVATPSSSPPTPSAFSVLPSATPTIGTDFGATPSPRPSQLRPSPSAPSPVVVASATVSIGKPASPTAIPGGRPSPSPVAGTSNPAELRIVAQGFGQDQHRVGYAAIVENTSRSMVSGLTAYAVTAYDATGATLLTAHGNVGIVLPGQRQGVAGTFTVPGAARVARIAVRLAPAPFHFPWTSAPRPLASTGVALRPGVTSPLVSGVIVNAGPIGFDGALVNAVAYDAVGRIVGGGSTLTGPLPSSARVPVKVPITTSIPPIQLELYAAPRALPPIH